MPDRDKVIDGINKILEETDEYDGVLWDALALLKEQEAVKPYLKAGGWYCGEYSCRTLLGAGGSKREDQKTKAYSLFCRKCGRRVKWE